MRFSCPQLMTALIDQAAHAASLPTLCPIPSAPEPLVQLGSLHAVDLPSYHSTPVFIPLHLDPLPKTLLLLGHNPAAPRAAEALLRCLHHSVTPPTSVHLHHPQPASRRAQLTGWLSLPPTPGTFRSPFHMEENGSRRRLPSLPHLEATLSQHRPRLVVVTPIPLDPVQELPWDVTLDPGLGLGSSGGSRPITIAPDFLGRATPLPRYPPRFPTFRPMISCTCSVPFCPHPPVESGSPYAVDGVLDLLLA